jgi:hypothetical protein
VSRNIWVLTCIDFEISPWQWKFTFKEKRNVHFDCLCVFHEKSVCKFDFTYVRGYVIRCLCCKLLWHSNWTSSVEWLKCTLKVLHAVAKQVTQMLCFRMLQFSRQWTISNWSAAVVAIAAVVIMHHSQRVNESRATKFCTVTLNISGCPVKILP